MKAVFLCAGFGTRLYPLTENQPKSLLPIAGEPLLNHLLRKLEAVQSLDHAILVSNGRFYPHFLEWQRKAQPTFKLTIVNDGTMDPDHHLGAIRDLKLALEKENANDDVLVLAGDNLFDSNLLAFTSFALRKCPAVSVGVYELKDRQLARKYGLIKTDSSDKITAFFEKPKDPPSLLASMGVYFFPKAMLHLLDRYLQENQNPDAPGYCVSWLAQKMDVFVFRFTGSWFDIGDLNSYQKADRHFQVAGGRRASQ